MQPELCKRHRTAANFVHQQLTFRRRLWEVSLRLGSLVALVIMFHVQASAPRSTVASGPVARCEPRSVAGPSDDTLYLDLYIEDVVDVNAVDLRLNFDATVAQAVDVDSNAPGVQIQALDTFLQPDFVISRAADNTAGTVVYQVTQVGRAAVNGSGAVARVGFDSLTSGTFDLAFAHAELARLDGSTMLVTANDCTVSFTDAACYDFDAGVQPRLDDVQAVASRWQDIGDYSPQYDIAPDPPDGIISSLDIMEVVAQLGQPCATSGATSLPNRGGLSSSNLTSRSPARTSVTNGPRPE